MIRRRGERDEHCKGRLTLSPIGPARPWRPLRFELASLPSDMPMSSSMWVAPAPLVRPRPPRRAPPRPVLVLASPFAATGLGSAAASRAAAAEGGIVGGVGRRAHVQ